MNWIVKEGQRLESKYNGKKGTIIKVNNHWGRMIVRWDDGKTKEYSTLDPTQGFIKLSFVTEADRRLILENAGITDSWRDYD